MSRRKKDEFDYSFKRTGAFGVFKSNGSMPAEYLMTTFTIEEIPNLSLARDINSSLNFDYLIQRDIDQERALSEISRYITSVDGATQKEIVFLPPLLVSVVQTDSKNDLVDYYPDNKLTISDDDVGEVYTREWPGLFKVTNYAAEETGKNFSFETVSDGANSKDIDFGQASIELNLTKKNMKGAKLVVIDGQHRLFALEHLRQHEYSKVKDIVLPVCMIYSANSCKSNVEAKTAPKIPSFMRSLFVDVNSTVERVSGHFLTLLQDNTLGSIICRDFCNTILASAGLEEQALALVEWNTKNHKESLTITREHTLTSIGVINSAFEETFKSASGIKLISSIIGLKGSIDSFDFGVDEYDQSNTMPKDFPWRDFSLNHKEKLTELVHDTITGSLIRIFFETSQFKSAFDSFKETLDSVISDVISNRDPLSNSAEIVKNHLLYNDPISTSEKSAKVLLSTFQEKYKIKRNKVLPALARKTIFQKSLILAWSKLLEVLIPRGVKIDEVTTILIKLIEHALDKDADLFGERNPHVQGTIYDGSRVKVTKESKNQISRLILSKLSDREYLDKNSMFSADSSALDALYNLGLKELSTYYQRMIKDKTNSFVKSYKSNFSIPSFEREKLIAEEERRDENLKKAQSSASKLEASRPFDNLVLELLADEFDIADKSLAKSLNKSDSSIIYILNGNEDE